MAEKTRTIEVNGREIEVPEAKIDKLIAYAMEMEGVQEELTHYRNLQNYLQSNPQANEAVQRALADPASVLGNSNNRSQESDSSMDFGDDEDMTDREKKLIAKLSALEGRLSKLDEIEGKLSQTERERQATNIQTRIKEALGDYGLRGSTASLIQDQVATYMTHNPGEPLSAVVAAQVALFRKALKEHQEGTLKSADETKDLETQRADSGTPAVTEPKKMTGKDLREGKILAKALEEAKGLLGGFTHRGNTPGAKLPTTAD